MPPRRDNGLINRQQIGGHDRPLPIFRRQRFPQAAGRELIAVASRHAHYLPRAAVQGYPDPPRLLIGAEETPQLIDFDPYRTVFFLTVRVARASGRTSG
jgi:hypothetical protein